MSWETWEKDDLSGKGIWVLSSREELMQDVRFKDYTILDTPQKFSELFRNQDYLIVELVNTIKLVVDEKVLYGNGRFEGSFMWINNEIMSLDGDSYDPDMTIYGYMEFSNMEEGVEKGLTILVGNDW